ncbi:mitotic phosphoprotein N' end (MPPN) family protein [Wolffia australiana]
MPTLRHSSAIKIRSKNQTIGNRQQAENFSFFSRRKSLFLLNPSTSTLIDATVDVYQTLDFDRRNRDLSDEIERICLYSRVSSPIVEGDSAMSGTAEKSGKSGRRTVFYRDLASPISSHKGRFASPGQAASVSALWRENFRESELPPPPAFTLDDRSEFSPESGLAEWPISPETKTPAPIASPFLLRTRSEASPSSAPKEQTPASATWWSPAKKINAADQESTTKGSPVDGVVLPGALITLPPPREVARPELPKISPPIGSTEEEEWITVYGFSPCDTNLVLRELEKCGFIQKHVPGPGDANWMHVLYQNRYDAQKALLKNGMQISGGLIVGVKPVEPAQRIFLSEKPNGSGVASGFMVSLPPSGPTRKGPSQVLPLGATAEGRALQGGGAIASPAKSVVSKIMDLMFGI